jgi:hypothetical protein
VYWLMAIGNIGVDIYSFKVFRSLPPYVPPATSTPGAYERTGSRQ